MEIPDRRGGEELQRKARPEGGNGSERSERQFPPKGYAQITTCNTAKYLLIFAVLYIGVDWFRQQDQWVSKHAENRSAISLIPCYKILTGDQEFALAA
ncbi:hypothetical protein OA84_00095 [Kaistella solincola]|uniref:Uncharacterized protein n=1 Tax=Kaistella solincola TaxID=510955 RepID=A0ABR4ZUY3_9FLAO|nr:hypothetical protein OA84_00095 [Kaistella solincola]